MRTFAQKYADFTKEIIAGEKAIRLYYSNIRAINTLVTKHRNDLKIGVWSVDDGYVVISEKNSVKDITYYPENE